MSIPSLPCCVINAQYYNIRHVSVKSDFIGLHQLYVEGHRCIEQQEPLSNPLLIKEILSMHHWSTTKEKGV